MNHKLVIAPLLAFLVLMLTPMRASAQTPAFPQVGQSWTYNLTGGAVYVLPVAGAINYTATATYTVLAVSPGKFSVSQVVAGTVIWPSGLGTITYVDMNAWSTVTYTPATSNTSFAFSTTADISLNDSGASAIGGDKYSTVSLCWKSGANNLTAYVGFMRIFLVLPAPFPPFFASNGFHTFVHWNTSYPPWGNPPTNITHFFTNTPSAVYPAAWIEEAITTAYGVRTALKNQTADSGTIFGAPWSQDDTLWIDKDSGILLNGIAVSTLIPGGSITTLGYTTVSRVELVSCNFFGILGFLLFTHLFGIPLVYLIVGVVVIVIVLVAGVLLYRRRK